MQFTVDKQTIAERRGKEGITLHLSQKADKLQEGITKGNAELASWNYNHYGCKSPCSDLPCAWSLMRCCNPLEILILSLSFCFINGIIKRNMCDNGTCGRSLEPWLRGRPWYHRLLRPGLVLGCPLMELWHLGTLPRTIATFSQEWRPGCLRMEAVSSAAASLCSCGSLLAWAERGEGGPVWPRGL